MKIIKSAILFFLEGFIPFVVNSDLCSWEIIEESYEKFKSNKQKFFKDITENFMVMSLFNTLGGLLAFLITRNFFNNKLYLVQKLSYIIFSLSKEKFYYFMDNGTMLIFIKSFVPGTFPIVTYLSGMTHMSITTFILSVFISKLMKCYFNLILYKIFLNKFFHNCYLFTMSALRIIYIYIGILNIAININNVFFSVL